MYDQAILSLNKSIKLDLSGTNLAMAFTNMGAAYSHLGQYVDAITVLKRTIEIDPDSAMAHHNLGVAYMHRKEYDKAISELEKAIELKPDSSESYESLGDVYNARGNYNTAITQYKRSIELQWDRANVHAKLGDIYCYKLRRYDDAISEYRIVADLQPDDPKGYYNIACVYSLRSDAENAIEFLKQAIDIDLQCINKAREDRDFDPIRGNTEFQNLISPTGDD
jgi:tetratricopeptide (TPR) repeat protein